MKHQRTCLLSLTICLHLLAIFLLCRTAGAETCEPWIGKAVSAQGGVQCLRAGERQWRPVTLNDTYCPGDTVRISSQGRAVILLFNGTTLRLNQNTTISFSPPEKEKTSLIDLLKGAIYFFSRERRSIRVVTPFVNATIEGTEFYMEVTADKTFLSVFEGLVIARNQAGEIRLTKGQSATAMKDQPPVLQIVARPRDTVQWTLYYPPVLDTRPSDFQPPSPVPWQERVRKSMEFYEAGDLEKALASIEEVTEVRDPRFFTYRASLLLSVGRVDEARTDLQRALQIAPDNSQALALESIIAVAQNEKEKALGLARRAVEAEPRSASARIALSYALQANFDLQGALNSLKDAVKLEPDNALAWARLAELRLSFGELQGALQAANKAASLNPGLARTQTVLGFAYLAQIKTKKSKEAFQNAMILDQADPLPRLGLGLATIRDGDLAIGRAEIEVAASLDPSSSLIRSYLGKAYYEEKRDKLASNQFAMAKELDPQDPTSFFYDAILKQSVNEPVEALVDLQKSISLNDNRTVYRSRLLLDSDLAARSASLGRIYSDLGFQWRALVEGWKSVNTDPANFSAHRFLADSYSALPRHEIARVSELLQSQLLQPININPVQPHLAESSLFILNGAGPTNPSFNEFNPLFNRNRFALQASGVVGGQSTWGDEVVQNGVWGPLSYSLGQFHYETDGYRNNNDLKQNIYNVFAQGSLSYNTSLQAEFRSGDFKQGDLTLNFFGDFLPDQRIDAETNDMRLGFHHAFSPRSDLIGSFVYADLNSNLRIPSFGFSSQSDSDNYSGELQYLFRSAPFNLVGGAGYAYVEAKETIASTMEKSTVRDANVYLYSQIHYPRTVTWTIGADADILQDDIVDRNQVNPKLGVTWNPVPATTLRGALFRVLSRTLVTKQTLEPTQVAGFNQFFDDAAGTDAWCYGVAIDEKFSDRVYAGAEYFGRNLKVPALSVPEPPAAPEMIRVDWNERLGRAYFYWIPHPWFGVSVEYLYEKFDRDKEFAAGIERVTTHRVPAGIYFYHPSGISAQFQSTYVNQQGRFQPQRSDLFKSGEDQFWVADAWISYRFPKQYGLLTVGAKNLFNSSFHYQDTDPVSPWIQPKRLVYGKLTLSF